MSLAPAHRNHLRLITDSDRQSLTRGLLHNGYTIELHTPIREIERSNYLLQEMARVAVTLSETTLSSPLIIYRRTGLWRAEQPLPTLVVANQQSQRLIEGGADTDYLSQILGGFWDTRTLGQGPLPIGRPTHYATSIQSLDPYDPRVQGEVGITGSGAVMIGSGAPYGLMVEAIFQVKPSDNIIETILPEA